MTTLASIFPPDPPPFDHLDRKAGKQQPHGVDSTDEATTVTLEVTRVMTALDLRQHGQRDVPDMAYTADWLASASAPLHSIIEQHERNEERDESVIQRLLDRIGTDALRISGLYLRIDALEQDIARERNRAERLALMIARGNSTYAQPGTNE